MDDGSVLFGDILDKCVSDILDRGRSIEECLDKFPDYRGRLKPLLETTSQILNSRALGVSEEFRWASHDRLINLVNSRPIATSTTPKRMNYRFRLFEILNRKTFKLAFVSVLIILMLIVSGITSVAYASTSALPGTIYYPFKLTLERFEVDFAPTEIEKAALRLQIATRRIEEVERIVSSGESSDLTLPISEFHKQIETVTNQIETGIGLSEEDRFVLIILLNNWIDQQLIKVNEIIPSAHLEVQKLLQDTVIFSRLSQDRVIKYLEQYPMYLTRSSSYLVDGTLVQPEETGTAIVSPSMTVTGRVIVQGTGTFVYTETARFTPLLPKSTSLPLLDRVETKVATLWPTNLPLPTQSLTPRRTLRPIENRGIKTPGGNRPTQLPFPLPTHRP